MHPQATSVTKHRNRKFYVYFLQESYKADAITRERILREQVQQGDANIDLPAKEEVPVGFVVTQNPDNEKLQAAWISQKGPDGIGAELSENPTKYQLTDFFFGESISGRLEKGDLMYTPYRLEQSEEHLTGINPVEACLRFIANAGIPTIPTLNKDDSLDKIIACFDLPETIKEHLNSEVSKEEIGQKRRRSSDLDAKSGENLAGENLAKRIKGLKIEPPTQL